MDLHVSHTLGFIITNKTRGLRRGRQEGIIVYYESIKRELNKRLILECRCDARLKAKTEGSTRLGYTR